MPPLLPLKMKAPTGIRMRLTARLMLTTLVMSSGTASARVCTCRIVDGCGVFNAEKITNIAELGPALPPSLLQAGLVDAIECFVDQGDKIEIGAVALTPGAPSANRMYAATVPGNEDCSGIVVMGMLRCGR